MNTPTRKTSEDALNQFNIWMRSQPWFVEFHKQKGLNPSGNGNRKLSRDEQSQLESLMKANGVQLPDGMHIDSGGSLNQKNRLGRNVAIGAGLTAATLATMGAAGVGPMAGMFGTSAPVAGGTAALGAVPEATFTSAAAAFPGATAVGAGTAPIGFGTAATTTAAGGGGLMSKIGSALKNKDLIGAVGRGIGAAGDASAQNRGAQASMMMDYETQKRAFEQNQVLAEKTGRDAQSDAMNKALWGEYTANYQPLSRPEGVPTQTDNSISDNAREAGRMLSQQARDMMQSGKYTNVNPQIRPFEDFPTEPGLMERVGNYAGPALNYYDLYNQLFGKK